MELSPHSLTAPHNHLAFGVWQDAVGKIHPHPTSALPPEILMER